MFKKSKIGMGIIFMVIAVLIFATGCENPGADALKDNGVIIEEQNN